MFSLYLALSIKTKCAERWSERRDRVSFGNISALRVFAFFVLWRWESQEYPLNKIPNAYDSRFACKSYSASAR